jgi:hypothetical protein
MIPISVHFLIVATARACSPPSSRGAEATSSEGNVLNYIIVEYALSPKLLVIVNF